MVLLPVTAWRRGFDAEDSSFKRPTRGQIRLACRAVRPLRHLHRPRVDAFAPEAIELCAALFGQDGDEATAAAGATGDVCHTFLHDKASSGTMFSFPKLARAL